MDLPEFLSPPPEKEAIALALDQVIFEPLVKDAKKLEEAGDDKTPPLRAFMLLDGSINPDIAICAANFDEPARCLFAGAAGEELGDVGPWLVELKRYGGAWDWYVEDGWGNNWGILIHTRMTLAKLKTHLKKFIKVEDEDGETFFFKYYRPEHLNTFLPEFDPDQQARFFKDIAAFFGEQHGTPETILRHRLVEGEGLVTRKADLVQVGLPLRPQPPSDEEVDAILADLQQQS